MGLIPLDIYLTKKILKRKVYLKHLTFMTSSQTNNIFLNIAGKIRLRFVNKNYIDGCDTPSYMTKQIIEKEYGVSNVFIARNGTSKVAFINKEVKREKDYIYIGRLSKGRNTDKLLEAFAKSNKNIDIYGFGEMESLVRGFSKKCSNINFYGKVPYTQLTKILYQYKYGIDLTYVDTEFGKASYSQKIAQYLSFGLNVLAIDCVDNEYIKENNCGVLYNVDSNSLIEIVNSYEYRKIDLLKIEDAIYSDKIVNQLIEFWKQK
jgi:glycosyltransferase involved in cell wall biosynthesis